MIETLTPKERETLALSLPRWSLVPDRDALARTVRFADFRTAFGFMTMIALTAEKADHHPEWSNIYDRIDIVLTTHDAGGLSQRDVDMALEIDRMARALGEKEEEA